MSLKSQVTEELIIEQIDSLIEIRTKDTPKALSLAKRAYENATALGKEEWIAKISSDYGILLWLSKNHKQSIEIFLKAIPIAEPLNRSRICSNLAMVYKDLGKVDSAFFYNEIAIKELEAIGDTINTTRPIISMVQLLDQTGNYQEALDRLLAVRGLFHKTGDVNLIMNYNNINGTILMGLKDYESAIIQFERNIEYIESIEDVKYERAALSGKAQAFVNIGLSYFYLKDRKKALDYYDRALEIQKELNVVPAMGITIFNIAETYLDEGELVKAELYCIQSYNIFKDVKDKKGEMLSNALLGEIYTQRGQFIEASEKYAIAESMALAMDHPSKLISVYENWSELSEKQQDYRTALEYYKKRTELNDSLFNREKQQRIDVLKTQYGVYKKDTELEENQEVIEKNRRTRNFLINLLLTSFFLVCSIGIFAYLKYKERKLKFESEEHYNYLKLRYENQKNLSNSGFNKTLHDTQVPLDSNQKVETADKELSTFLTELTGDKVYYDDIFLIHKSTDNEFRNKNQMDIIVCQDDKLKILEIAPYKTLKEILDSELPNYFKRPNRLSIINKNNILSIGGNPKTIKMKRDLVTELSVKSKYLKVSNNYIKDATILNPDF